MSAVNRVSASNYVSAGRSAVNNSITALRAARENSPKYDDIVNESRTARAQEKAAAFRAESNVAMAGIRAERDIRNTKIKADKDKSIAKSEATVKKAGKIAAAGQLIGGSITEGRQLDERKALLQKFEAKDAARQERADKNTDELIAAIKAGNAPSTSDTTTTVKPADIGIEPKVASISSQLPNLTNGWERLSRVIRFGEGTSGKSGYNTQFTGSQFTDLSKHPRQINSSNGLSSDAAGAYQFLSTTWDGAKQALDLPDFSPESQEKAARYLTQQRGVNPDTVFKTKDEFRAAMDKLAPEWASLPYSGLSPSGHGKGSSYYGQGGKNIDELWSLYNN